LRVEFTLKFGYFIHTKYNTVCNFDYNEIWR